MKLVETLIKADLIDRVKKVTLGVSRALYACLMDSRLEHEVIYLKIVLLCSR